MRRKTLLAALFVLLSNAALTEIHPGPRFKYPKTDRGKVVDVHHGSEVSDPYRWLEDDVRESKAVQSWVEAQNKVSFGFLERIPERKRIIDRLTRLWNYEKYSSPFKVGGRYFYYKNDGLQNQYVMYMLDSMTGQPQVLFDPNTWSEDGTIALTAVNLSPDSRYAAYSRSEAGSDWQEWYVRDVESGKDLGDRLQWVKFGEASWTLDGKGFFYSRFDEVSEDLKFQALNKNQQIYYHRVGTPQSADVLVYRRPEQPDWGYGTEVSEDGRYLIVSVWVGTDPRNRVLYRDLTEPYGMPLELIDHFDHEFQFIGNDGPVFFFRTDNLAPNRRVIAIDSRRPEPEHWREIVPETEHVLRSVRLIGNLFIGRYLRDASSYIRVYRPDGGFVRELELPGIGTATGFSGKRSDIETFYTFSSFNRPPTIYRYDMITGKSELWREARVNFNPDDYVVSQVFYNSKDGTRVPMFVVHRKDVKPDGKRPTLLYGYGGFNIALSPRFSVSRLAWMEMGGVFALPNLRGGGEYGEAWHEAGTKLKKQNVFDDFIAAAEWLIDNGYTETSKLAIQGGSNGGLLVGASLTQRPDLFGAALPAVGVMDMLRFHKFTAGRYWVDDYGSAEDPEEFKALYAYSPYHNIKPDTTYPATLVTTADTDDRVVPGHSFKFAAALQQAHSGDSPVLIRVETRAGHGGGKPTRLVIEEIADSWAFLVDVLDFEPDLVVSRDDVPALEQTTD